ncbi:hypothetical protein, partial [Pseudomonas syringae]|uniref:hypothetical protein n=1 Tax=Pseudomonas syringae TaxID=317 RepID=UPI001C9AC83F
AIFIGEYRHFFRFFDEGLRVRVNPSSEERLRECYQVIYITKRYDRAVWRRATLLIMASLAQANIKV